MTEKRATDRPSTLALDSLTGGLRMGAHAHPVADPTDRDQVYGAYLSLLYAVRGARRGEEIPLRSTDLDALLAIVGEDVEQIEQRLVALMGCTPEEATLLRRVLVRHRNLAASVGAVAGLSLVALLGPNVASATSQSSTAPTPSPSSSVVVPANPSELPPLTSYATTDDGAHVPIPDSWTETSAAPEPVVTASAAADSIGSEAIGTASVTASVSPSPSPSASPAPSVSPAATPSPAPSAASASPSPSVVPSPSAASASPSPSAVPSPSASTEAPAVTFEAEPALDEGLTSEELRSTLPGRPGPDDEVVLGDPMAPIDRPGWSPEDEVVLGEPMTPIDRPAEGEPADPN